MKFAVKYITPLVTPHGESKTAREIHRYGMFDSESDARQWASDNIEGIDYSLERFHIAEGTDTQIYFATA